MCMFDFTSMDQRIHVMSVVYKELEGLNGAGKHTGSKNLGSTQWWV